MSKLNFEYVPLTFVSDKEEIKKQVRNTLILIYLFEKYKSPVRLEKLIEGTQYGFNASALQSGRNKFLRISDIYESKVDWDTVPYCNCDDEKTYLLKDEDILIARTGGTTGKSFKIHNPPKHSIYAGYLIRIRAKEEVNPNYIYLFLHSFAYWSQIVNLNERNFRPKANAENLKDLLLPDCPKEIQDEVVRISEGESVDGYEDLFVEIEKALSEYDKVREVEDLLLEQLTQIENLNHAILQEAVQGKLVKPDKKDRSASELLKRMKNEEAKSGKKEKPLSPIKLEEIPFEIPENWVWCRLNEIGRITGGGTPSMQKPEYWNGDIPWVSPKDMWTEFVFDTEMKVTAKGIEESSTNLIPKGSILIVGRSGILKRKLPVAINNIECTVNQDMKVIVPHVLSMNRFLQLMLRGLENIVLVNFVKYGMTVHSLKYDDFAKMPIPLPPLSEQQRIVAETEKQLVKTKQLKEHIIASQEATEQLLKALLHQAFEVSEVGVAEKEVSVLALAAEPEVPFDREKVISFYQTKQKEENHFVKRKVLATYIINQSLNDPQFGDVKFEKLLHLSDYFAIKRNLGQKFYKKVAGPLDNAFTTQYFTQIEKSKWFNRKQVGRQFFFSAGTNHDKSLKTYDYFSDEELKKVNKIIGYFKKSDYEKPEIVSTLYAVWNNRVIKNEAISDTDLITDFYDWDEAKKKYPEERLRKALQWMKSENFIPDGWGNYIDKPKAKKK